MINKTMEEINEINEALQAQIKNTNDWYSQMALEHNTYITTHTN